MAQENKTAFLQLPSGISGDMLLGAFVDAGVTVSSLKKQLGRLGLRGYSLSASEVLTGGFRATRVTVKIAGGPEPARRLRDVKSIISGSPLPDRVKKRGQDIFNAIFRAEARVHGSSPGRVHLHELGATDALVDIMGASICMEILGIHKLYCSAVNLGTGFVSTAHGTVAVPAPATMELMRGLPVYAEGEGELTTPTGAAIISTLASGFGPMPAMTMDSVGVGAGQREGFPGLPNIMRLLTGRASSGQSAEQVAVIEANIDDMSPEAYEHVMGILFEQGALDVWLTPVIMKKSRPACVLSAICGEASAPLVMQAMLRETTSLGLRHHLAERMTLGRRLRTVETPYGRLRVKDAFMGGRLIRSIPEYEDASRAARRHNAPLMDVMDAAKKAARSGGDS